MKLSQYADDTTLLLNGDKHSLMVVMDILRWFNKMSGLGINKDKTKVIKIWALRDRRITWEGSFGLEWTHSFVVLGIQYEALGETTNTNILSKINDIKKLIRTWSCRQLTPYGKVTIVKSLLLSKITHILLSLPSPSPEILKQIDTLFLNFVWSNKPAKFSRSILEAEIRDGGLKLHNLSTFDQSLKLGWLKRYLKSDGKWKIFADLVDFNEIFSFGSAFTERVMEIAQVSFWSDVLKSLKALWKRNVISEKSSVFLTPLWYNDDLRLPLKPEWLRKGITIIADLLDDNCVFLSLETFQIMFNIKTNFLEYGGLLRSIRNYIDNHDIPNFKPIRPTNCLINVILSSDAKGVSNLYRSMYVKNNNNIVNNICTKWFEKGNLILAPHEVRDSFSRTNYIVDDIYLKYIQFRTLHYRYFTNDILVKIGIKDNSVCSMCKSEIDSNFHMLIDCPKTTNLWLEVKNWIRSLGMETYCLTDRRKILGDLENSGQINIIILNTKQTIFQCKLDGKVPFLQQVKANVRQSFLHDEYKYTLENKQVLFNRKWSLLIRHYNKVAK